MPYGQILCGGSALERRGNFVAPTAILVDDLISNVHVDALSPITFVSTMQTHDQVMDERQPLERIVLFTQSSLAAAFQFTGANVVGVNCEFPREGNQFAMTWMTFVRRTTCTVNTAPTNSQGQSQQSQHLMDPSAQITSLHVL